MRKLMWFSICAVIAIAFVVAAPLAHADSLYCCQYCSRYANGTITCSPCMCGNQCIGVQGGCHGTVTLPKTDLPHVLDADLIWTHAKPMPVTPQEKQKPELLKTRK